MTLLAMNTTIILKTWRTLAVQNHSFVSLCHVKAPTRLCSTTSPSNSKHHDKNEGDCDDPKKKHDVGEKSEGLTGRGKEALSEGLDITQQEFQEMDQKSQDMKDRAQHLKDKASDD